LKNPEAEPVNREVYLQKLWDANYAQLAETVERTGNADIPFKYEANPSLGAWCFAQRMAHKKNKLTKERYDRLMELGFKF
jgi:hypothetical protein